MLRAQLDKYGSKIMRKLFENPWVAAVIAVAVVAIAVVSGPKTLQFKDELLTKVVPGLLASLFAIAAIMERGIAVLNDIWFGEDREKEEERVRLTGKKLASTRMIFREANEADHEVIKEAVRAGNNQMLEAANARLTATSNAVTQLESKVHTLTDELKTANTTLAVTEGKVDRARLTLAFSVAVIISAVGIRTLEALVQGDFGSEQKAVFHAVDILLTAGVLAGGTSGVSAIADLLGSYVNASRKRALEGG
jgi:hypothetical protein